MPKILFINSVCNGSTGTICKNLYKAAEKEGYECYIAFGRGDAPKGFNTIRIGNQLDIYSHVVKARLFDASGFGSKRATIDFIKKIDNIKPDIIHLHNIHGYYINVEILFDYLKKHPEIKKIWTLHDCWAFTGHCPHFDYEKCEQWKNECRHCVKRNLYPKSFIDNCKRNYVSKKDIFNNVKNMILVSPSDWLRYLVYESFLKDYHIETINNGIDLNIFKKMNSDILEKYNLQNKKIILGVSSIWNEKKGLNYFMNLSKNIKDPFQIVLIGLTKVQIKRLPSNILGIERTKEIEELVKWYSSSFVFLNPTLEDNYPTVNLEAQACGCIVITNNVGGCQETLKLKNNILLKENDCIIDILSNIKPILKVKKEEKDLLDERTTNSHYLKLYEL